MTCHITGLGYLRMSAQNVEEFSEFVQEILGFQPVDTGASDAARYFRMDEQAWRFSIEEGPNNGCQVVGWEVETKDGLAAVKQQLMAAGVAVKEDEDLAAERKVCGLLQAVDPNGFPVEFFYGLLTDRKPFMSPTGARFVTGEQGMGHIGLHVDDMMAEVSFYTDILGFGTSDEINLYIKFGESGMEPAKRGEPGAIGVHARFLHCNSRHHSLACVAVPDVPSEFGHLMLQLEDFDMVGRVIDVLTDRKIGPTISLGRHSNDHMLSIYTDSASGTRFEYGWGARQVEPGAWRTNHYDAASKWGHRVAHLGT